MPQATHRAGTTPPTPAQTGSPASLHETPAETVARSRPHPNSGYTSTSVEKRDPERPGAPAWQKAAACMYARPPPLFSHHSPASSAAPLCPIVQRDSAPALKEQQRAGGAHRGHNPGRTSNTPHTGYIRRCASQRVYHGSRQSPSTQRSPPHERRHRTPRPLRPRSHPLRPGQRGLRSLEPRGARPRPPARRGAARARHRRRRG